MKEQIIAKIQEACPELHKKETWTKAKIRHPHLEHLLRTVETKTTHYFIDTDGNFWDRKEENMVSFKATYDLTLSVEENLNNKELCEFIHSLICE
jgi:hypothetical protein